MKVVYTDKALHNLDEILAVLAAFELRLRAVEHRIGRWPNSATEVEQRPGVRVVPLLRYPYKIFYQVTPDAVEVVYIHHAARSEPSDQ